MNAPSAEDWPTMDELRETTAQMTALAISSVLHGNAPAYVIGRGTSDREFMDADGVAAEARRAEIRELKAALAAERATVASLRDIQLGDFGRHAMQLDVQRAAPWRAECLLLREQVVTLTQQYERLYHEYVQQTEEYTMPKPPTPKPPPPKK